MPISSHHDKWILHHAQARGMRCATFIGSGRIDGSKSLTIDQLGWTTWSEPRHLNAMEKLDSRVTIHMAASLDGFIARRNGSVDWLETSDEFVSGESLDPDFVETFLKTIDCYVMGSRTYETALNFEAKGLGWAYGDKPAFVLTSRDLPRTRDTVEFYSGDLSQFVNERLRPAFGSIWFVGGGSVIADCLRRGLADEIRYSILPILIGDGIPFFEKLDRDVVLHLAEVKAYKTGIVELRYEVRQPGESGSS